MNRHAALLSADFAHAHPSGSYGIEQAPNDERMKSCAFVEVLTGDFGLIEAAGTSNSYLASNLLSWLD